jgi:hypothetical protein
MNRASVAAGVPPAVEGASRPPESPVHGPNTCPILENLPLAVRLLDPMRELSAGRAEVYFLASAGALVETAVKTMPVLMFRPGRAS